MGMNGKWVMFNDYFHRLAKGMGKLLLEMTFKKEGVKWKVEVPKWLKWRRKERLQNRRQKEQLLQLMIVYDSL